MHGWLHIQSNVFKSFLSCVFCFLFVFLITNCFRSYTTMTCEPLKNQSGDLVSVLYGGPGLFLVFPKRLQQFTCFMRSCNSCLIMEVEAQSSVLSSQVGLIEDEAEKGFETKGEPTCF